MITSNHQAAKLVLPHEGWAACGVTGRPFEERDLASLQALGAEDPNFSWERTRQEPAYFEDLLHFRMKHYDQHAFGVHGLWVDDVLVGQFGLQSLDVNTDQVEFAIFLGGMSRHRGLGRCLARYLVQRCSEAGIENLWAVVRPDNPEGLGLIASLGMRPNGNAFHFGQAASFFTLDLRKE